MSRSSQLYDLQLIDSQLDRHRNRLHHINAILANNQEVQAAEATMKAAQTALKVAEVNLREAEQRVREQRLKIKQTEAKLYGGKIHNPKQLQDLPDESQALKRFLEVVEDRQLACMLDLDDHRDVATAAQESLEQTRQKTAILHQELTQERSTIQKETLHLENMRATLVQSIQPPDLALYEKLRKQRLGVAVSLVNERACSACGATLTAALNQAAHSPSQLTHCDACGRILFAN
jgi:predicted  nucleic acid-binding Zn-ribbon protein